MSLPYHESTCLGHCPMQEGDWDEEEVFVETAERYKRQLEKHYPQLTFFIGGDDRIGDLLPSVWVHNPKKEDWIAHLAYNHEKGLPTYNQGTQYWD